MKNMVMERTYSEPIRLENLGVHLSSAANSIYDTPNLDAYNPFRIAMQHTLLIQDFFRTARESASWALEASNALGRLNYKVSDENFMVFNRTKNADRLTLSVTDILETPEGGPSGIKYVLQITGGADFPHVTARITTGGLDKEILRIQVPFHDAQDAYSERIVDAADISYFTFQDYFNSL